MIDPGMFTGSEDVSWFAREAGVPLVFWFWGGVDPQAYAAAAAAGTLDRDIPTNHSPFFAPVLQPTLDPGVANLVVAAREWLAEAGPRGLRAVMSGTPASARRAPPSADSGRSAETRAETGAAEPAEAETPRPGRCRR